MSYRTYVNGTQIFGNHEVYPEWIEFIKSQGIEVDEENAYRDGEIKDFMGALEVLEKIVLQMEESRRERLAKFEEMATKQGLTDVEKDALRVRVYGIKSLFDWTNIPNDIEKYKFDDDLATSLFDELIDVINSGYAFLPFHFFNICKDQLERDENFSIKGHFHCFKIKDGEKITVEAY